MFNGYPNSNSSLYLPDFKLIFFYKIKMKKIKTNVMRDYQFNEP